MLLAETDKLAIDWRLGNLSTLVQVPSIQDQRADNYRRGVEWRPNPNQTHFAKTARKW
jgi:hypothetical protein